MADRSNASGTTCAEDGCLGVALPTGDKCWAHSDGRNLDAALERLRETGRLDASGVPISERLLDRLLANLPHDDQDRLVLSDAHFDRATFQGDAGFTEATFQGAASFSGVTFRSDAHFSEATFQRDAQFDRATVQRDGWFQGATFHSAQQFGPILVRKGLLLDEAVFHQRIQIQISAAAVCCRRTRFLAGVELRIRWAQVALGLADLAAPSLLANARPFSGLEEGRWARALERLWPDDIRGSRPRLLAVRRADVAGLTLSGVDLRACRFIGAHHLDQLRVEESDFPFTPMGWRWTPRQTIAEEHHWRATRSDSASTDTSSANLAAIDSGRPRAGRTRGWYRPATSHHFGWGRRRMGCRDGE